MKLAIIITKKYLQLIEDKFYPFRLIGELEAGKKTYLVWVCADIKNLKKVSKIFESNVVKMVGVEL